MVAHVRRVLLIPLALAACPGSGGGTQGTSTGPALTSTGDEPTGGTTDACMGSSDCDTEGICVADYEAVDTNPPAGMRSAAECVAKNDCIGPLDLGRWCFDHLGCCEDLRCHPADGTCEPPGLGETTSGGATDASTSTGDTQTGSTSDTASSGGSDSSGAGSTTGSTTGSTSG